MTLCRNRNGCNYVGAIIALNLNFAVFGAGCLFGFGRRDFCVSAGTFRNSDYMAFSAAVNAAVNRDRTFFYAGCRLLIGSLYVAERMSA